ncbi:hypothetical protein TNCV_3253451 [Trichonephila clavipes]|nr:hypothetical protein TNCV_3253451 [Trichonephila clavipes]
METDEDFAPPEITGFTDEDKESHRAYRKELYFVPSLDEIPEEEELEKQTGQKRSLRWIFRNMFQEIHLLWCLR